MPYDRIVFTNIELQSCTNRLWQKLKVKFYSHSHQPSKELALGNVLKSLKLRSNVLKALKKVRKVKKPSTLYDQSPGK